MNQFQGGESPSPQRDKGLILQRQLPSSQVPRFNPHPPMEPPKPKKESTYEPISPVKRKFGLKKNPTENEKVDYSRYNIEELLLTSGVEFRNPEKVLGGWLPLEAYDDKSFDTRLPQAWINQPGSIPSKDGAGAQGLWKDKDGLCYWRKVRILKYLPKTDRYEGYWENTREKVRLARIFIFFDEEDPRIFARRFRAAYNKRINADALIKYNYYIENMPKHQIPEIEGDQVNRVLSMTQNSKSLRGKSSADTTTLLNEVNVDFAKTMNKIIFDKHINDKGTNLITGKLELPPAPEEQEAPQFGMIKIPPHNFPKQFSKFCFRTLQIKDEVIRAQQEIRKECNDVAQKDIFNPNVTKTMKVDEFKQIQTSSITQTSYYLKETWLNKLKEIIKTNFIETSDSQTAGQTSLKSWFNLQETNKEVYEASKLKKFLVQQKFVMEHTLLELTEKSVHRFVDSVLSFLPISCVVKDTNEVTNTYYTAEQIKALGAPKPKFPLFQVDVLLNDANEPVYSHSPEDVVQSILKTFDHGLSALLEIGQLEQKLLPHLFKSNQKLHLKVPVKPPWMPDSPDPNDKKALPDENTWIYVAYEKLEKKISESIEPLNAYLKTLKKYDAEYKLDPQSVISKLDDDENPPEAEAVRKDVIFHKKEAARLMVEIPDSIVVSMFQINVGVIRDILVAKHTKIANDEIELIAKSAKRTANNTIEAFYKINDKINSTPKDIEELSAVKDFMASVPNEVEKLDGQIKLGMQVYKILEEFKYRFVDEEDYDKQWRLYGSPLETKSVIDRQRASLEKEKEKFVNLMQQEQQDFDSKVNDIGVKAASFIVHQDINNFEDISQQAKELWAKLQWAVDNSKMYNNREALTGNDETNYDNITAMVKEFEPLYSLWTTTEMWRKSHKSWLFDPFESLDSGFLEECVENSEKTMNKVIRQLKDKDVPGIKKIAETVKLEVDEFKDYVPLAVALRTEGMKERHWQQISDAVKFEVKPYEGMTFQNLIDLDLNKFKEQVCEIGERAGKEYNIETSMARMKNDWTQVFLSLKPFRASGTCTVLGFDEAINFLDEHQTLAQTLQFSPFKKPFEQEIEEWCADLLYVSNVIEEWLKCQKQWQYLQPIFDSPDIMKQLPGEAKRFKGVDKTWKDVIKYTKDVPNTLETCLRENKTLLARFEQCNNDLDRVQKGLKEYLEAKRTVFARFYFLSNDDLLEILSQTKDVEKVQSHLRKVFENMTELKFEPDKTITAMLSGEKEMIVLSQKLDPKDKKVEDWMGEVENMMFITIRDVLEFSIKDYKLRSRPDWIKKHPGQCVLNGSQVHWTSELEEACQKFGNKGVSDYCDVLEAQLLDTVALVRQKLNKLQSITLGALIVIDVHAKEVIRKLKDDRIDDINAFEWISQLRYYWVQDNCFVRCIQTNFPYGYEYLGNTQRLVITPLTDKCYMTLMGALKLDLGGAPAGPAGTGKTESTKDLAKALAKQCVVFNCSPTMEIGMISNFFKGLCAAGAWCCFDEFNRINIEVLSVIAQQLLHLFGAKGRQDKEVFFEESHIKMKPTFCVFITMNPGYAGRTELPDNLKALFRPVAMMVPDYGLIGEIMLYSFGFTKASLLSKKMVTTFSLASQQLSSQDHYDYGMRAVRSVINAAGLLKMATPDMNEDQLLLRALRDVNVPKFLKDDLPLFENIISDLFPGVKKPEIDYGNLMVQIKKSCTEHKLQPVNSFLDKIIQLYDTIQVRHGLMLVGPTGGGKTVNYKMLAHAMSALKGQGDYQKVHYHILNPKSITMEQLYGGLDPATNEWNDGIAAILVAEASKDETIDKHWIMFDGPVDALWIESMNTVLDDNKKLCLNSGAIINLTAHMTMMFEVEDLSVASPATVSRCGMIYMEPGALGITPLIKTWMEHLPPSMKLRKQTLPIIDKLFEKYCEPMINFTRKNCPEPVVTVDNNLAQSMFRILDCFMVPYHDTELKKVTAEEVEDLESMIEALFVFAAVWSVGCTTTLEGRAKFNNKIKEIMGKDCKYKFPNNGTCYDYKFVIEKKEWIYWTETVEAFTIDGKASYSEIIVPTFDSIRMKFVKGLLIKNKKHVLAPGPTGTGKTVNIMNLMNQEMPEEFSGIPLTFSAQTSANQTQDAMDTKFEKRRKGIFGPPVGKKLIIFIDDLNMPKKEEYGAQPPIELLRQWMDHKGWYNRLTKEYMEIQDIIMISAMGPPGGGRSTLTQRLQRHYNIITYSQLDSNSIEMIFSKIVNKFLGVFSDEVKQCTKQIVDSTQIVYNAVEDKLKPIPAKSHYTFNLRDMSKIFQGVCSASSKLVLTKLDLIKLWVHENQRVFGDRMINDQDKQILLDLLMEESQRKFDLTKDKIFDNDRIIFGDFAFAMDGENRPYQIINDLPAMLRKIQEYLEDYNSTSKTQMKLILFLDACDHVARICRVLRQPLGNALLLGVGGSGRQSLARLATFISQYKQFQIEVIKGYSMRDWRDNLKTVLMIGGVQGKPTSFIFVDTQIINENMLEDINTVLNSGDVPQLYKPEDDEPIMAIGRVECTRKGLQISKMNMFQCYLNRVKANIHMVMAMSPLGEVFRSRLRMFPSLVNCCTIDWFTNWPAEALVNVARGSVQDPEANMQLGADEDSCIELFKIMHQSVEQKSEEFKESMRRINYVTPTSYLELLSTYKKILASQRFQVNKNRNRLARGLDVLKNAAIEVDKLQRKLEADAPVLAKTQIEVEETKKIIAEKTTKAEAVKSVVVVEEEEAAKQAAEVKAVKDDADSKLGEALPELDAAVKAVAKIDVKDFYELRTVQKPGPSMVACFKLCCFFLVPNQKPKKPTEAQAEKDPEGYWQLSQETLLKDPKGFLNNMINYDKDNTPDALIKKVQPLMAEEVMSEAKIANASQALKPVRIWIAAMIKYHAVLKIVNPMRAVAAEMGAKLAVVMAALAEKQKTVREINAELDELRANGAKLEAQAKQLQEDIEECHKKLYRAEKMIGGLEGEKNRWTDTVASLTKQQEMLVGDCLVASGMICYAGPFTAIYRDQLETMWRDNIKKFGIKVTSGITMRKVLGNDVTIRQWAVAGLPSDNLSIENGIIMFGSRRWPLMIDPQTQANKFIKNMGKGNKEGLECFKPSHPSLIRDLEISIQFGKWVLLENIGQDLDPALEPILLMLVVKSGSGYSIKVGEKSVPYNSNFKFFMTTTLPNPHYSPETSVKVTLLNFAITPAGLEEQMLNNLISLELPELQETKNQIVEDNARSAQIMYELEDKILAALSDAAEIMDLLKDDNLITILADSKTTGDEINVRRAQSEITEKEIDITRESFRRVAYRASILFFCINDLNIIDPMYQYSLQWFQRLFAGSVRESTPSDNVSERIQNLNEYQTLSLYQNVCRSLFERHKLLFSLLLCTKILFGDNKIDMDEWRFFLAGPSGEIETMPNPTDWLDDLEWVQVHKQLFIMDTKLPVFRGILEYFISFHKKFKKIFDSPNAHEEPLPGEWNTKLNSMQKMIVLKAIRADKVTLALQDYITEQIGKQYITPPTFRLSACYKDSSNVSPLIFVLSSGSDPIASFKKLCEENDMLNRQDMISLGQGQAKKAEAKIANGMVKGWWILLQNCHLSVSWLPKLEAIVEGLQETNHPEFRLWLTSMPSPAFPVSVLQNSVKMTMEPPTGLRQNLLQNYEIFDNKMLNDCRNPSAYKKILFAFSFFHAIVQDRRKFGAIGWNIPYAFTYEDFDVCRRQLKIFLDNYEVIPFKVLNTLGAEINYGGRVTDDKDVRLIKSILQRFVCQDVLNVGFNLSDSGLYRTIPEGSKEDYVAYIQQLPLNPHPEAFGLHENAEIITNQNETRIILENVLSIQPRTSSAGGKSREQVMNDIAVGIQAKVPPLYALDDVAAKFPTDYNESMNTVLTQEAEKYNKLLSLMKIQLKNIQRALVGEVVMSEDLEKMGNSLFDNQVPVAWADKGFLSLKPLASWMVDLLDRIAFFNKWIQNGSPPSFWISGFIFPQAFFTATLQNYARKHIIAIDELDFECKVYDEIQVHEVSEKPEDGAYIYGMYMEGARWNSTTHVLDDSKPKQLYTEMPIVWFLPKRNRKKPESGIYECPVYKVLSRSGTLATTGLSTNYCLMLELPSNKESDVWTRAGVAIFLALRY